MQKESNSDYFLKCKDHTVSGEVFTLVLDTEYDMLRTVPKPDQDHIGRYYESTEYISHTDGKKGVFEKLYQLVKRYAIQNKIKRIVSISPTANTILDIGAGTGDFLVAAKNRGWSVNGVEPNEQAQKLAKQKGIVLSGDSVSLESNSFDVITMWHVLEHVSDLKEQIAELKRLLKPGGFLWIAVPNFKSYDAQHYQEYWAAYDVPRHLFHFSERSIKKLFQENGLIWQQTLPMKFDSFYVSLLSEKYKHGSMKYLTAGWIGLLSNLKARHTKQYSSHIYVLRNQKSI